MTSETAAFVRPYSPSWFDRLEAVLNRSRVPAWVWYTFGALLPVPLVLAADWASGVIPVGVILPFHVFLATLTSVALWYTHFLDGVASRAVDQVAPDLSVDKRGLELLRYELTTMPARPTLVLALLGAISVLPLVLMLIVLDPGAQLLRIFGFSYQPISLAAFMLVFIGGYMAGFVFLYHSYRQLRLIGRIYRDDVKVDIVDLGPIYAFSRVTALTALGIQVQADLWIVTNPAAAGALVPVASVTALTVVAAVIFLVPLRGIHRRIATEKGRALVTNAITRESLMSGLRDGVAQDKLDRVTAIKDAVLALDVEAKALAAVRTWPWEPETLRLLLTAVLLPTALFVVQYVVREILGT